MGGANAYTIILLLYMVLIADNVNAILESAVCCVDDPFTTALMLVACFFPATVMATISKSTPMETKSWINLVFLEQSAAFAYMMHDHFLDRPKWVEKRVVSIGDSNEEKVAMRIASGQHYNMAAKAVKFITGPDPEALACQLDIVT